MNSGSTDGWETVDEDDDSMGDSADGDQQLPQSTYLYTPLRNAGRHIRVLSLAPADWEEPLVGSFEETSIIDGQGEYEALSYCWTSTEDCHPGRSLLRSTWKHYPIHIEDRVLYVGVTSTKPSVAFVSASNIRRSGPMQYASIRTTITNGRNRSPGWA